MQRGEGVEVAVRDVGVPAEPVSPAALAWLLLPPALVVAASLTLLLAGPLGQVAFPDPGYHYWPEITVVRKPAVQAGALMAIGWTVAYAAAILVLARRAPALPPHARRIAVAAVQALAAAFLLACWIAQRHVTVGGSGRVYFTAATVLVAALLATLAAAGIGWWSRRAAARGARPRGASPGRRALALASVGTAVAATAVWVLPAVYTDSGLVAGPDALFLGAWFLDESAAVVNGRTPLVDMVAYGNLWPYLVAIPLGAFGGTYLAYTVTMAALTVVALLALFATLVRVTRRALAALVLYLPIVAMAFFIEVGTPVARYSPGTYYGMFPLRFAGPCLLVLLTALYVGRDPRRRRAAVALFAAGGLVAINNLDFGGGALLGTVAALALARWPLDPRGLVRLAGELAGGLAVAVALVCLLTLLRAGELPHPELLSRYGRIFVIGGNGNLPLPALGLHLAIAATFVGAVATAAVRAAARERNVVLTAVLAWSGLFGLGASLYYFAYRSHPDVLVNLFPAWTLTLALLVVAVVEAARARSRLGLPALAVLFAFGLAACSIAQLPDPWKQADRIGGRLQPGQPVYLPPEAFRAPELTTVVRRRTRPGERVLVLSPTGHRVAEAAGVVNVSPYPGLGQMPAREQLREALDVLRREGGDAVFVLDRVPPGFDAEMRRLGVRELNAWQVSGWPSELLLEFRATAHH